MEEEKKIAEEIGEKEGADATNGTPSPSPSKKKQKQVHGILKSGKKEARCVSSYQLIMLPAEVDLSFSYPRLAGTQESSGMRTI